MNHSHYCLTITKHLNNSQDKTESSKYHSQSDQQHRSRTFAKYIDRSNWPCYRKRNLNMSNTLSYSLSRMPLPCTRRRWCWRALKRTKRKSRAKIQSYSSKEWNTIHNSLNSPTAFLESQQPLMDGMLNHSQSNKSISSSLKTSLLFSSKNQRKKRWNHKNAITKTAPTRQQTSLIMVLAMIFKLKKESSEKLSSEFHQNIWIHRK